MSLRLPYPGLRAFTREESDLFFGREDCSDAMVECLGRARFMAVLGPSGSGKSSLVRTGLLEALALGQLSKAGAHWKVADLHPGREPMRKLAQALLSIRSGPPADETDVELMTGFLRQGPRSIVQWATAGNLPSGFNLLILVDQFEELFRYADYEQQETAEAFVAALLEAASAPGTPIYVLLTMRSEYLGACASIPRLAERISAGLYLTARMDRDRCREAIEGPAGVVGFEIEPALVNRLLNDLASFAPWEAGEQGDLAVQLARQADQLPLMQHVLNRLWLLAQSDATNDKVVLTLAEYERIGGLSGALDAHGREVMDSLGAERQSLISAIFRSLVTGNSLATAVRQPCSMQKLVQIADGRKDDVVAIVDAFRAQGCNFLRTTDVELTDSTIVDISHESLIRQWTPLSGWLEKEVRDGNEWQRLLSDEERYSLHKGGLLTGLSYQTVAAWWSSALPTPAWAERHGGKFAAAEAYLEASRKEEQHQADLEGVRQRQLRSRLWAGLAVLGIGLVGVSIAASIAHRNADQARVAQAGAQAAEQKAQLNFVALSASQAEVAVEDRQLRLALSDLQDKSMKLQAAVGQANRNFADEQTAATEATKNADALVTTLRDMGDQMFSDTSNYELTGQQNLESNLVHAILNNEEALATKNPKGMPPAKIVHDYYQSSVALGRSGDAKLAGEMLKRGYLKGRDAIDAETEKGAVPSEELLTAFFDVASDYGWLLYDSGRRAEADSVRLEVERKEKLIQNPKTAELKTALAKDQKLEEHYYLGQTAKDDSAKKELTDKAKMSGDLAAQLATQASSMNGADIKTTVYEIATQLGDRPERDKNCELAADLYGRQPTDLRVISLNVECFREKAVDVWNAKIKPGDVAYAAVPKACIDLAVDKAIKDDDEKKKTIDDKQKPAGDDKTGTGSIEKTVTTVSNVVDRVAIAQKLKPEDISRGCYGRAEEIANAGIEKDPANTDLLLAMATLELGLDSLPNDGSTVHQANAKTYLVTAMSGKSVFPSSMSKVSTIYNNLILVFSDQKESAKYYGDIAGALIRQHESFPEDLELGGIISSAQLRAGFAMAHDPTQSVQAEDLLTRAVQWLEQYQYKTPPAGYAQRYSNQCIAYGALAKLYAADGKLDLMLSQAQKMENQCASRLETFPWDFPIRIQFIQVHATVGRVLFEHQRYQDALLSLKEASKWGDANSTRLLANIYNKGLVGAPDPQQAYELAQLEGSQGSVYLTQDHDIDFGLFQTQAPILVQQWPDDYGPNHQPRNILQDQVEWWKQTRSGTVNPVIINFLQTLFTYSKEHNLPVSQLTASFSSYGVSKSPFTQTLVIKWFPELGNQRDPILPSLQDRMETDNPFRVDINNGISEIDNKQYGEVVRDLDAALKLEPDAPSLLDAEGSFALQEGVLRHETIASIDFTRSLDFHTRAIKLGNGNGLDYIEALFTADHFKDCATLALAARDAAGLTGTPDSLRLALGSLSFACLTALKDDRAAAAGSALDADIKKFTDASTNKLKPANWNYPGSDFYVLANSDKLFNGNGATWKKLFDALTNGNHDSAEEALTKLLQPQIPLAADDPKKASVTKPPAKH